MAWHLTCHRGSTEHQEKLLVRSPVWIWQKWNSAYLSMHANRPSTLSHKFERNIGNSTKYQTARRHTTPRCPYKHEWKSQSQGENVTQALLPFPHSVQPMSFNPSWSSGHIQDYLPSDHNLPLSSNILISNNTGESSLLNNTSHTQPHWLQPQHTKGCSLHTNLSRQSRFTSFPNRTRPTKGSTCAETLTCKNFAWHPHWIDHKSPSDTGQNSWQYTCVHQPSLLDTWPMDQQPLGIPTQHPRSNPFRETVDNTTQLPPRSSSDDRLHSCQTHSQNLTGTQQLQTLLPSNHTHQGHKSCWHSYSSWNTTSESIVTHPCINQRIQLQLAHPTQPKFNCLEDMDQSASGTIHQTRTSHHAPTTPPAMDPQAATVCTWLHTFDPSTNQIITQVPNSPILHHHPQHHTWQEMNEVDNTNSKSVLTKQFKRMDGWSCNKAMTMTVKQMIEKHQETSKRELVDESSTVLCASMSTHGIPRSGILSQLLVT